MGSTRKQINARITDGQWSSIQEAMGVYDVENLAEFIRLCIAQACTRVKIEWPDDMPGIGDHNRKEQQ